MSEWTLGESIIAVLTECGRMMDAIIDAGSDDADLLDLRTAVQNVLDEMDVAMAEIDREMADE